MGGSADLEPRRACRKLQRLEGRSDDEKCFARRSRPGGADGERKPDHDRLRRPRGLRALVEAQSRIAECHLTAIAASAPWPRSSAASTRLMSFSGAAHRAWSTPGMRYPRKGALIQRSVTSRRLRRKHSTTQPRRTCSSRRDASQTASGTTWAVQTMSAPYSWALTVGCRRLRRSVGKGRTKPLDPSTLIGGFGEGHGVPVASVPPTMPLPKLSD